MDITFIGSGNMARGIGARFANPGNSLHFLDRDINKAQTLAAAIATSSQTTVTAGAWAPENIRGDIVVLAVPYVAHSAVIKEFAEQLDGRIIIDICIPLNPETFDELITPVGISAAEEIAQKLPNSQVVKAFNTTFSPTLTSGIVAGQKLDIFIAGDHSQANGIVSELVSEGGMRPIATGPLHRAQQLEAMGFIHLIIQKPLHEEFGTALKVLS